MRFGIIAMQINSLIPPGMHSEDMLLHIAGYDQAKVVRNLVSHGFNLIELGGDLSVFLPHVFAPEAIERLAEVKAEFGIVYTVHLPLWSVEPSTPLTPVRQGSVKAVVDILQATRPLAPEIYVLHATGALAAEFYGMDLPETAKNIILRLFQNSARESIQTILSETGLPSYQLAIETIEFPFDLTLDLAEELDTSICFDTGHVLAGLSGPVDLFEALERCLPRLSEIHLHDGPSINKTKGIVTGQDHQPLGTGDLDTDRLLKRLEEHNFTGPIIFEMRHDQALASLEVIRKIRPGYYLT